MTNITYFKTKKFFAQELQFFDFFGNSKNSLKIVHTRVTLFSWQEFGERKKSFVAWVPPGNVGTTHVLNFLIWWRIHVDIVVWVKSTKKHSKSSLHFEIFKKIHNVKTFIFTWILHQIKKFKTWDQSTSFGVQKLYLKKFQKFLYLVENYVYVNFLKKNFIMILGWFITKWKFWKKIKTFEIFFNIAFVLQMM